MASDTSSNSSTAHVPIAVDLDGSLVLTDTLHEAAMRLLHDKPLQVLSIPFWLMSGKAALKQTISEKTEIGAALLPYNVTLIDWLREQKKLGRKLVLCTAADKRIAQAVAKHLNIFF